MKALTVKQPYAHLILNDIKDIENRTWKCPSKYIGERVLIHSSSVGKNVLVPSSIFTYSQYESMSYNERVLTRCKGTSCKSLRNGAIIGSVEIVDCVNNHSSVWALPNHNHWVLANPILFPEPIPAKGKLSFWDYPNILAEPEEKGGELFCHCQLPVKEENQVMSMGEGEYRCRYCGGKWYK